MAVFILRYQTIHEFKMVIELACRDIELFEELRV